MVVLRVPLGDKPKHRALHPKVQKAKIGHGPNCQNPDAIGNISQPMDDEWHKEEGDCHIGNRSKPVKKHVSRDMSYTQLQPGTPSCQHQTVAGTSQPYWLSKAQAVP
jgi:hypothetical protein